MAIPMMRVLAPMVIVVLRCASLAVARSTAAMVIVVLGCAAIAVAPSTERGGGDPAPQDGISSTP